MDFFGTWRSLKWCQCHNGDDAVSLVLYFFPPYQQWWTKGTLGTHKTMARWFLTAKLE